jgi:hypothetical protein
MFLISVAMFCVRLGLLFDSDAVKISQVLNTSVAIISGLPPDLKELQDITSSGLSTISNYAQYPKKYCLSKVQQA